MQEQLIELFYEYLPAWSWEEWQAAGSSEREEIVVNAIAVLGPDVDINEAYDIFWDWAAGLTEADFNTGLHEAIRVGAGNDALYHYTNLLPFINILDTGVMKRPANRDDYAICFTTDEGYRIYRLCFGLQFSRAKLAADGYDLTLWDDACEDDPEFADYYRDYPRPEEARTESEERIYNNIPNITKYITDIHLHWSPEGMTMDQASDEYDNPWSFIEIAHGAKGDVLIGYDRNDNQKLISRAKFNQLLKRLQSKGIKVHHYGQPMKNMFTYDSNYQVSRVGAEEPVLV